MKISLINADWYHHHEKYQKLVWTNASFHDGGPNLYLFSKMLPFFGRLGVIYDSHATNRRQGGLSMQERGSALLLVAWESQKTPSRPESTKIPPQTVKCSHFLIEKLPSDIYLADRLLLKGEASRFLADFAHPLSCQRPFRCRRHLIQDFGSDNSIPNFCACLW